MLRKIIAVLISVLFVFEQTGFPQVAPQIPIPAHLQGLMTPDRFRPVQWRSLEYNKASGNFRVSIDRGDEASITRQDLSLRSSKLLEYFQVCLRLPNSSFWVNLRPDTADKIIDPLLEKTDLGKVLLAADLQLKKDLANMVSPDTAAGRQYWTKMYEKAGQLFSSEDIVIPATTRPWIVPGELVISQSESGVYIYKASLKVMLEEDYLKTDSALPGFDTGKASQDPRFAALNTYATELIKQLIIPQLTRRVNASKAYAPLRQAYYSMVLAQWYKTRFEDGLIDNKDLSGLLSKEKWSKDDFYRQYKDSFEKGEYHKEETVQLQDVVVVRQYVSGGFSGQNIVPKAVISTKSPGNINDNSDTQEFSRDGGTLKPNGDIVFRDSTVQIPAAAEVKELTLGQRVKQIFRNLVNNVKSFFAGIVRLLTDQRGRFMPGKPDSSAYTFEIIAGERISEFSARMLRERSRLGKDIHSDFNGIPLSTSGFTAAEDIVQDYHQKWDERRKQHQSQAEDKAQVPDIVYKILAASQTIDEGKLIAGGAIYWTKDLLLITPAQLAELPKGTVLKSINGQYVRVGADAIDDDTRNGALAFGFEIAADKNVTETSRDGGKIKVEVVKDLLDQPKLWRITFDGKVMFELTLSEVGNWRPADNKIKMFQEGFNDLSADLSDKAKEEFLSSQGKAAVMAVVEESLYSDEKIAAFIADSLESQLAEYAIEEESETALPASPQVLEQRKKLESVIRDQARAEDIARQANDAYNRATGNNFAFYEEEFADVKTSLTNKEQAIAMNLAGLYALETSVGAILKLRMVSSVNEVLSDIINDTLKPEEKHLVMRFANATWKAGQPFRGMDRLEKPNFVSWDNLEQDVKDLDMVQIKTAAKIVLAETSKLNQVAQKQRLEELVRDKTRAEDIARQANDAYNQATGNNFPFYEEESANVKTSLTNKEQAIAMNLAGLYALETSVGAIWEMREGKDTLYKIIQDIADGNISSNERQLVMRFANATWKAGQPFRGMDRLNGPNFVSWDNLQEDVKELDMVQIKAAAQIALQDYYQLSGTQAQELKSSWDAVVEKGTAAGMAEKDITMFWDAATGQFSAERDAIAAFRDKMVSDGYVFVSAVTASGLGVDAEDIISAKQQIKKAIKEWGVDPAKLIFVSGATGNADPANRSGVQVFYEVAEELGAKKMGIASGKAFGYPMRTMDYLVLKGTGWSDESDVLMDFSQKMVAFVGGNQAKNELLDYVKTADSPDLAVISGIRSHDANNEGSFTGSVDRALGEVSREIKNRNGKLMVFNRDNVTQMLLNGQEEEAVAKLAAQGKSYPLDAREYMQRIQQILEVSYGAEAAAAMMDNVLGKVVSSVRDGLRNYPDSYAEEQTLILEGKWDFGPGQGVVRPGEKPVQFHKQLGIGVQRDEYIHFQLKMTMGYFNNKNLDILSFGPGMVRQWQEETLGKWIDALNTSLQGLEYAQAFELVTRVNTEVLQKIKGKYDMETVAQNELEDAVLNEINALAEEYKAMSQMDLVAAIDKNNPQVTAYVKDVPVMMYKVEQVNADGYFSELPEGMAEVMGILDDTDYRDAWKSGKYNDGYVVAMQYAKGKPDFYPMTMASFKESYKEVEIAQAQEKNADEFKDLRTVDTFNRAYESKDSKLIAGLKMKPTNMVKMSELGFAKDKRAEIADPWDSTQVKEAGDEAYIVLDAKDDGRVQYYMVQEVNGLPKNYILLDASSRDGGLEEISEKIMQLVNDSEYGFDKGMVDAFLADPTNPDTMRPMIAKIQAYYGRMSTSPSELIYTQGMYEWADIMDNLNVIVYRQSHPAKEELLNDNIARDGGIEAEVLRIKNAIADLMPTSKAAYGNDYFPGGLASGLEAKFRETVSLSGRISLLENMLATMRAEEDTNNPYWTNERIVERRRLEGLIKGVNKKLDAGSEESMSRDGATEKNPIGGIDFRVLPLPAVGGPAAVPPIDIKALQALAAKASVTDVDRALKTIKKEIASKEVPYDKLKEMVAVCCVKGSSQQVKEVAVWVSQILKLEEECAVQTSAQMQEVIQMLEVAA